MTGLENMKKDYDNEVDKNLQKDDMINTLKEQSGNENGVRVSMGKDTPRCIRCNRNFKSNQDLDRHMQDDHNDKCTFCDLKFDDEDALRRHVDKCLTDGNILQECDKCNKILTHWGLGRHREKYRGSQKGQCTNP